MNDQKNIDINIKSYIETTLGNVVNRKSLTVEQVKRMVGTSGGKDIILVAATPKSGSTFLSSVLSRILELRYLPLCYAYSSNEHDLYLPALVAASLTGAVSQMHMRGTPHNVELLKYFSIRPIILTRNIFDSVESLARDLRKKCALPQLGLGIHGYSFVWLDKNISRLTDEQLIDFVISFAVPWYVNFFVSWHEAADAKVIKPHFLRYEDLMANKKAELEIIVKELSRKPVDISESVLEKDYLKNNLIINRGSGISGLGQERLNDRQKDAITRLLSFYPKIDFGPWLE